MLRIHGSPMLDLTTLPLRAAIGQFNELSDEQIAFALQCGVQDVLLNTPHLAGDERWEFKDLLRLRMRAEERGLRVICLERVMNFWLGLLSSRHGPKSI